MHANCDAMSRHSVKIEQGSALTYSNAQQVGHMQFCQIHWNSEYMICLQLQVDNSPCNLFTWGTAEQARILSMSAKAHVMALQMGIQISALTQLQHCGKGAAVQLKDVQ